MFMFFGSVAVQDPFRSKVFVRPFPWMWRIASGAAFLELLLMTFIMFQKPDDVIRSIHYLFPRIELNKYPETFHDTYNTAITCLPQFLQNAYRYSKEKDMLKKFFNWFLKAFIYRDWTFLWFVFYFSSSSYVYRTLSFITETLYFSAGFFSPQFDVSFFDTVC